MLYAISFAIVTLVGAYFVVLGVTLLLAPQRATRFLVGFASSAPKHYLELALRLVVGGSLLLQSPHLIYSGLFTSFGWTLVLTTAFLAVIPWKWHQRFARKAVPAALRYLSVIGVVSLVIGLAVIASLIYSIAT